MQNVSQLCLWQVMEVIVEVGEYTCSKVTGASSPFNNETICALKDAFGNQSMPPVNITIDFGDGSGEQVRMVLSRGSDPDPH